jgi:glycoprotein endo-alpha-1,2-mannosidase
MTLLRRIQAGRFVLWLSGIAVCFDVETLGQPPAATRAELNIAAPRSADDLRPVIGAYYYPWYGVHDRPLSHDWRNLMRVKLDPPQKPLVGLYRSDNPEVIAEHLAQSRRAGLDFWAVSWWGPDSGTDRTIREAIFKHPDACQLRYAVLYESTGRLGGFDRPRYDNLIEDLAYLEKHYFKHPHYLRINGRPVLFIYLSREYFRGRGLDELAEVRRQFPNVYIVGDDVFGAEYQADWAKRFDAVTSYDIYGQSMGPHKATSRAVETLANNYANAKKVANSAGTAFMPAVAPGYNDTAVRPGHPGTPRYFIDQPDSKEGDLFRALIRKAALPHLDGRCGRLLMVTSFNEWYEDSQIEATAGDAETAAVDSSYSKSHFTGGDRYTDYGPLYLDILREEALDAPKPAE